jgi:short-chain fatty acids transporter
MLIWHGGLSGSSLIKVAEPGHLESLVTGVLADAKLAAVPNTLGFAETAFSPMNATATLALLLLLPAVLFWVGRRAPGVVNSSMVKRVQSEVELQPVRGAERLDHSKFLAMGFGGLLLLMALGKALGAGNVALSFITPNWINLVLLGAALFLHGSVYRFLEAIEQAIGGASGILIQFPLYFGVMGLIVGSGLVSQFSLFMMQWSTTETYPLITFFSAAVVNVFVPSGGGQWALQGPLIVSAAMEMDVPLGKSILAMAYGDQLTNMLQPFWALPLLGITRLKAREIAPYTLLMMLVGALVFGIVLLVF